MKRARLCNTVKAPWALQLCSRNAEVENGGSTGMIYYSFPAFLFHQSSPIRSSKSNKVKKHFLSSITSLPVCVYTQTIYWVLQQKCSVELEPDA